eukprot:2978004-Pyramimonas_sp.AAC.1
MLGQAERDARAGCDGSAEGRGAGKEHAAAGAELKGATDGGRLANRDRPSATGHSLCEEHA